MKFLTCVLLLVGVLSLNAAPVPVIYGTDLYHPHEDPDDHFDLATLFALPELQIKAILLDNAKAQGQIANPGAIPLRQMFRLSKREVPFAIGLKEKLASTTDDGKGQPARYQGAVDLLVKALRESREPVTIIMAGSVRDLCAAWNRYPDLLKQKVGRLYLNIGNAEDGQSEYNVDLDQKAYAGILRSGLPTYLCLCLPMNRRGSNAVYSAFWRFRHSDVLEGAPKPLQNFFIYGLQRPSPQELDPLKALKMDLSPWHRLVWETERNMWCTAGFLHAAGRLNATNSASEAGFTFVPARIEVDDSGTTTKVLNAANPNVQLFKVADFARYDQAMRAQLRTLLHSFPAR